MKSLQPSLVILLTGALFAVGGCMSSSQNSVPINVPVEPNPPPAIEVSPLQRVQGASARLDEFDRRAQQLPGADESQDRVLMEQVFADLVIILPLLEGPEADAVFRQQVRLIESTQNQITGLPTNLPSEPLIGTGLRAADNALQDMFAQQFPDQTNLTKPLSALSDKLDALDTAHDAANRQLVADAVRMMGAIMRQMDDALAQRLQQTTQPSTAPSTQP
jgi:hypothetical protein